MTTNLSILNVEITSAEFVIAPIVYIINFAIVLAFFTYKFQKQRITVEYMLIIFTFFLQTFCLFLISI